MTSRQELENIIVDRFNQFSDNSDIVSQVVDDNDFRLKKIKEIFDRPAVYRRILDVGSGKGKFTRQLKDWGFDVVGVEPAEKLIEIAGNLNPDIQFFKASATELPFPDNSFDGIIRVEVLEQIPHVEHAIQEMARVLRPNGKLLIIDNNAVSLHPRYLIPISLWYRFLGEKTKWKLYPRDFVFEEHHFTPRRLNDTIKKYFSRSEIEFIHYSPCRPNPDRWKEMLIRLRTSVSSVLHKCLPFLDFYVLWKATK